MKELRYNLSCRLFTDAKCFGPGVAQLLHRVERLHSLRAAAAEMEMAYSKAWTVIKNAENALGFKLLASTTGGRHGGGAALTPEGKALLTAYDRSCTTAATGCSPKNSPCLWKNDPIKKVPAASSRHLFYLVLSHSMT